MADPLIIGIWKSTNDLLIFDREREVSLIKRNAELLLISRIAYTCVTCYSTWSGLRIQSVVPYVLSDWFSWLLPSILSPTCYVLLVYFIAKFRPDNLAANLFTMIASVGQCPRGGADCKDRTCAILYSSQCNASCEWKLRISAPADDVGIPDPIVRGCFDDRQCTQSVPNVSVCLFLPECRLMKCSLSAGFIL